MRWYYRIESENLQMLKKVRPPYVVIPNHVMTWDPLVVSYFVRDPIYFVASDANFRNPFFSWWLRRVGAIAKAKLVDDLGTVRWILKLLKEGKLVGLFAEGQRTWDGATLPIIPSTAKLVRMAAVPVVVALLKGAYGALPRWAFESRRGKVVVEYRVALTAGEAASMSTQEITSRIEETMRYDEATYQRLSPRPYVSKRPAEPLQLTLFYCPECEALNTMRGDHNLFRCGACGYEVRFSNYGWFTESPATHHRLHFRTIREWSLAQNRAVADQIRLARTKLPSEILFQDSGVLYSRGYRLASLVSQGTGTLAFTIEALVFRFDSGRSIHFPWEEITALNVVYQDQLEFYYKRRLCVFQFPSHDTSGYKYLLCGDELARQLAAES